MKTLHLFSLLLAITLIACEKEKPVAPSVQFDRPLNRASFSFGDTILVLADVNHASLKSISVTIVDAEYNPVEEVQQIHFNQIPARVNTTIIVKNKRMQSGKHYVRIQTKTADGELYNHFREIAIGALEKKRIAIYTASQNQEGTERIFHKIIGNQINLLHADIGNCSAIAANGFYGSVIFAPASFGNRIVFETQNDSVVGQEQNPTSFTDTFMEGLYRYEDKVYGMYANGQIVGYAPDGIQVEMSFILPTNYIPKKMLRVKNTFLILAKRIGQNGKVLLYYNALTRAFIRQIEIGNMNTAIAILPNNQSDFVILFNDYANVAKWERYDLLGQYYAMPNLPNWFFADAVSVASNSFVFATNLGLFKYTGGVSGFLPLANAFYKHLAFDDLNGQLVAAVGTGITIFKYPEMTVVAAQNVSSQYVVALDILYNK